jgi:hypothetical protein
MSELIVQEYKPLTASDIQNQVNTIQHVMRQVMKEGVHYGVIPGCKQPSLFKPGAEKIMATFRLAADPEVTDMSNPDMIRYQVKVRLTSPSGNFVGSGIGECSSNEEKYKWRRAVCKEEFEDTPPDRRREKWKKYGQKPAFKEQQIRTEPADLANTILKMAKKRAQVDAVITATAASDCFTQDLEDLPEEYLGEDVDQRPAGVRQQQAPVSAEAEDLVRELGGEAEKGWEALKKYWAGMTDDQRKAVGGAFGPVKKRAEEVDKNAAN